MITAANHQLQTSLINNEPRNAIVSIVPLSNLQQAPLPVSRRDWCDDSLPTKEIFFDGINTRIDYQAIFNGSILPGDPKCYFQIDFLQMSETDQISVLEDMVDFNLLLMNRATPDDSAQIVTEYIYWVNGLFSNIGIENQDVGTIKNLELLLNKLAQKQGLLSEGQVLRRKSSNSQVVIRDDGKLVVNVNDVPNNANVDSIHVSYYATDGYLSPTRDTVDLQLRGIALQLALGHGDFISQVRLSEVMAISGKSLELEFVTKDNITSSKGSKRTKSTFSPDVLIVGIYKDGSYAIDYARIFDLSKNSMPSRQFETGLRDSERNVKLVSSRVTESDRFPPVKKRK